MLQKDYIMRMIAQLSQVLTKILFAKQAGRFEEALRLIQNGYEELLGLNGKLISTLDARTLAGLLDHPEKIKGLAHLLVEEAEVYISEENYESARTHLQKARLLFEHVRPMMPDSHEEIDEAVARISDDLNAL